jgi:hypothetical protein
MKNTIKGDPMSEKITTQLKYKLYEDSVQCHESDIEFMNEEFKKHRGKDPLILREDFGGTGAMACDWVKQGPKHEAYAIDLDPEPIGYGKEHHFSRLAVSERDRMHYLESNVLDSFKFEADIVAAFNFSYFIFKKRSELLHYFKRVREDLHNDGAFFLDLFGGTGCCQELIEETEHDEHSYFWDCDNYNPVTGEVLYYIHFKTHKDKKRYDRVFTYDWRMWNLPELQDLLYEAGFSKVVTYWEEDDDDGGGNGVFYEAEDAENCESWVTYLCALK